MGVPLRDLIDPAKLAELRAAAGGDPPDDAVGEVEVKGPDTGMTLEHKADVAAQVLDADDETGVVTALVSATNIVDRVKDHIEVGAYAKTIAAREPIGVWSHDDKTWVARTESAEELPPGHALFRDLKTMDGQPWPAEAGAVKVKARFNLETPHGKAAYSDVKFFQGKTGWSIGYRATKAYRNARTGVRHIKELEWYEYSPVMVGAASQPMTLSVKSLAQPVDPDDPSGIAPAELVDSLDDAELARFAELKASLGLEVKERHVRTAAGVAQYGQPIGSIIKPGLQVRVRHAQGRFAEVTAVHGDGTATVIDHVTGKQKRHPVSQLHHAPNSPYSGPNMEVDGQAHLRSEKVPGHPGVTYGDLNAPPAALNTSQRQAWRDGGEKERLALLKQTQVDPADTVPHNRRDPASGGSTGPKDPVSGGGQGDVKGKPVTGPITTGDELSTLGELHRDSSGHEVWRIHNPDGTVNQDGVASDHDAEFLAKRIAAEHNKKMRAAGKGSGSKRAAAARAAFAAARGGEFPTKGDGEDLELKLYAVNVRRGRLGAPPLSALPLEGKDLDLTLATDAEVTALVAPADDADVFVETKAMGHESLNRSPKKNWIEMVGGQLPAYIQHVAKDISEERGVPLERAIPIAIGTVKRWARGGGGVKGDTVAKAAAAVAEWEALKAKAHAKFDSDLLAELEEKAADLADAWNTLIDAGVLEVKDLGLVDEDTFDDDDGGGVDAADLFAAGAELKAGLDLDF